MTRKAADLRDGGPRCSCSPVLLGSLIGKCRGTSAAPSKAGDRLQDTNNGRPCRQKSRRGGNAVRRLTDCRASLALYSIWAASRVSVMISRMGTAPKFVVGTSGRREAVLLDMNQYRRMLRKLEDLEDALALDRAERTSNKLVPYEDVRRRLEHAGKVTRD